MKTAFSFIAGVSMLALTGIASAQEPVKLTDAQMDKVTAGATVLLLSQALANATAQATGNFGTPSSTAATQTVTVADPTGVLLAGPPVSIGQAAGVAAAFAVPIGPPVAAAASHADAAVSLE